MSGTSSLYGTSTRPVQIADRGRVLCAANPWSRGAGCGSPARPDLWGAWAGNRPGLPDSQLHKLSDRAGDGCVEVIEPPVEYGVVACEMKPLIRVQGTVVMTFVRP